MLKKKLNIFMRMLVIVIYTLMSITTVSTMKAYAGANGKADGTYDFSGTVGPNNSAGPSFATFSDKFVISNGFSVEGSQLWSMDQQEPNTTGTLEIKAEGNEVKTFTFKNLGISSYEPIGYNLSSLSVQLRDINNNLIATLTNSMQLNLTNATSQLSNLLNNGIEYNYENVSSIIINWKYGDGHAPSNLNFDNITIADVSANITPTDSDPPIVGNGGIINPFDVTPSEIRLDWAAGTDNLTIQGDLEYQIYQSTSDNISQVNTITNGIPITPPNKGMTSYNVSGLAPNTTYYFNVLVKDAAGNKSVYTMKEVKTASLSTAPIVMTDSSVTNLTASSTNVSGNVTSDGNAQITERGIVYATTGNPTINGNKVTASGTKGTFTVDLTSLNPKTKYFYRAYATNSLGTSYGEEREFTTKNNIAALSNLSIAPSSLNEHFASGTTVYTATVPNRTAELTVNAIAVDPNATVNVVGASNGKVTLDTDGSTEVRVEVTAEDGTVITYTIVVIEEPLSDNAYLRDLIISTGPLSPTLTLNPAFNKDTVSYTTIAPPFTSSIMVSPFLEDDNASVKLRINDRTENQNQPIYLNDGENKIDIIVTAEDQLTMKTYTVNVYRLFSKTASTPTITPTVTEEDTITKNGLVITPHAEDADVVTHYKISDITGGLLYKNDGVTPIDNGNFITKVEGESGLKFLPNADTNSMSGDTYAFKVQAALDGTGLGLSDFSPAGITVTEVNDEPKANSDSLPSIDENSPSFKIPLTSLLANDWAGPDNESGQTLMITNVQSVDGGTVRLDGTDVIFTPNPNYRGMARFDYTIMDNGTTHGAPDPKTDESMVLFTIEPRADQPTVTNAVTNEDEKNQEGLVITPTNADGATTTHYKITGITGGSLYKNDGVFPIVNGDFITVSEGQAGLKFQPAEDQYGTTGFGFLIQAAPSDDGEKLSDSIQASIIVKEVNDNPIATDDQLPNKELISDGISITFEELLQNDLKGPENENDQTLTIISVEDAVGGTATIQDGKVIFIPNQTGLASFDYRVQDNGTTNGDADSLTDSATVQFTVVSKPVIQLQGDNRVYIELGSTYKEPGFTATDELDGDLTDEVTISGIIDYNQLGIYPLNYNVVNSNGLSAVEMMRNVQVVSTDLQTLSVSAGNLTPSFDKTQTNYDLIVPSNTATIVVSAGTLDVTANVGIDSHIIGNAGSESIPLQPGANTVSVVVTAKGGFTKTYTLQITRELTNVKAPTIVQQPINKTVTVGDEANLMIAAEADIGTLSYQWYSNTTNSTTGGKLIPGATGETYSAPTAMAGATYFYAIVTTTDNSATGNKTATTTSEVAAVTVTPKSTNAYLAGLTVSNGALSPAFTKNRETYTVNVANSVSTITFTSVAEETGKATVTVNGEPSTTSVPLTIGANKIKVVVTAEDGVTKKTYTITVNRAQLGTSDGGNPAPVPTPQPSTEQIIVDVDGNNGSNLAKTPITRTTEANGTVKDKVAMTHAIAKETVQKAKEQSVDTARIMIPDKEDKVSEIQVEIPKSALAELNNGNLKLEIVTANAVISIPTKSIDQFNGDLYFRIVPIKSDSEKQQVEERAKKESLIQEAVGNNIVQVIGRPMEIETNMQSREVSIVLPLTASLPTNEAERENLLNNLGVYIEHSDGSKELIKGTVVKMQDGSEGLHFTVNKFSTFTMLYLEGWEEEETGVTLHIPYIKGYANNEFRPDSDVTRAQMATMLAKNLNATPSISTYKDVSKKHGAYEAILEVREAGIMTGKTAVTFDPNGTVTRAQMAAIVYRWMQKQCNQDTTPYESCGLLTNIPATNFTDVKDSHWAKEAMYFTKAADIMVGEGNKFRPEANLTRAQAVKVLNRLFKRGPLKDTTTSTFKDVPTTHWAFGEIEEAAREHNSSMDKK